MLKLVYMFLAIKCTELGYTIVKIAYIFMGLLFAGLIYIYVQQFIMD